MFISILTTIGEQVHSFLWLPALTVWTIYHTHKEEVTFERGMTCYELCKDPNVSSLVRIYTPVPAVIDTGLNELSLSTI